MSSTAIASFPTRPVTAAVGAIQAFRSTNMSTAASTGRTLAFPTAVRQITAQTVLGTTGSTKATVTFKGSLYPTGGWTTLKSTTWTSTQAGTLRIIATSTSRPVTHLKVEVDLSTTVSTALPDCAVWLAASP